MTFFVALRRAEEPRRFFWQTLPRRGIMVLAIVADCTDFNV
jgi:hypothetical protein